MPLKKWIIMAFSRLSSLQWNDSSQNSVRTGEEAANDGERSNKNSLIPGMTDCWMPNPIAPAQELNFCMSGFVTQASLPIHWRGIKGFCDSSFNSIFKSPAVANAIITVAVDLQTYEITILYQFFSFFGLFSNSFA